MGYQSLHFAGMGLSVWVHCRQRKGGPFFGPPGKWSRWVWLGRRTLPGKLDESAKRIAVADRDLGEHLAVHLDAGLLQAVHQLRIAQPLLAGGGVDADDPEAAEVALAV